METLGACPLCFGDQLKIIDREFNFEQCSVCGLVFDNPRPTLEAIARHYSKNDQYDSWLDCTAARERMWKLRLKKMLPNAAKGSLLDVGAGIGQFLDLARPYFSHIAGTELSTSACAIAAQRYGIKIDCGTIESLDLPTFDNLTMFHVLEHVMSPGETLRRCYELLNPGGMLFICVPNDIRSWTSRMRVLQNRVRPNGRSPMLGLRRCGTVDEIHLSHFTYESLEYGLQKAGFKVVESGVDPAFAETGWRYAAHFTHYWLHDFFGLRTYLAMWFVAKKP